MASLYQAYVEIVPEARNLRATLAREFDAAGPEAGAAAGRGINSGVLGSVGRLAAPLAAAFASIGIGKMVSDSIGNASDFAESATAISAVFGDADQTIQKFAAGSATALGQSTNMTLDAARTFGVFGKAAGLSGDDLAGFSTDFITLSADLASFNNTTPEQAIEALGAGLRGESEPLRQYGILLDDAALKARATELGIYSGTGALTAQQKVLASQAEIMAQSGIAQGDFAKTSGGLANQQRILSAGLENLSTTFGALLLPVMLTIVGFLNTSVIPALQNVMPAIQGISDLLISGNFTTAFREAFNVEEDSPAVGALLRIRDGIIGTKDLLVNGDFNGAFRSAFNVEEDSPVVGFLLTMRDAIIAAGPVLAGIGGMVVSAFGAIGPLFEPLLPVLASLVPQLVEVWQAFSPLSLVFQAIGPMLPQLVGAFVELAAMIGGALGSAIAAMLPTLLEFSGMLVGLIGGLVAALLPIIIQLVGIIGPLLGAVLTAVLPLFTMLMGVVMQLVAAIIPLLAPVLALIVPLVELVAAILPPLISLFVAILTPIIGLASILLSVLVPVLGFVVTVLSAVVGWVAQALAWFVSLVTGSGEAGAQLAAIWGQTMGMFSDFFSNTFGMFSDFFSNTFGMVRDFGSNVGSFFSNMWSTIGTTFSNGISGIVTFFTGLPAKIVTALGDMSTTLVSMGKNLIQGLLDGAGSLLKNIGTFFLNIVPAWIQAPFKAALGIASPSKVFAGYGENIGQGLLIGVGRTEADVNSALGSLVDVPTLSTTVDSSIYGSGSSSISGGVYVQNPWTGEYLLAKVSTVANTVLAASSAADASQLRRAGL
jgi:phage-related protein